MHKVFLFGGGIFLFFMLGLIGGYFGSKTASDKFAFLREYETLETCIAAEEPSLVNAGQFTYLEYCYSRAMAQRALADYDIRRHVFETQLVSDVVLLWMVVVITLSGVMFSGLQILASYKIAATSSGQGQMEHLDSSLIIERDKLSLKSSVTGLFILMISLAFFYIFVSFVYEIEEVDTAPVLSNTLFGGGAPPPVQQAYGAPSEPSGDLWEGDAGIGASTASGIGIGTAGADTDEQ